MMLKSLLHFLRITLSLNLSGFLFEDNRSQNRWIGENGEISFELPRWYSQIGLVEQFLFLIYVTIILTLDAVLLLM